MNAVSLYQRYTTAELTAMAEEIRENPANANPQHAAGRSIYLYTPAARKKLDAIAWAITYHLRDGKDGAA